MKKPTTISKESVSEYREFVVYWRQSRSCSRKKSVLGTDVDSTVFRKLNELAYRTRIRPASRGNKNGVTSG